ncbi:hypothetical protein [Neobacillus dielmonensis]|uniref:hypothetical protein n=1 Tax=Neobacillus dielmonensis TaxID=1347369 RepID=UPI0005AA234B|nr:hypothetical protein [Neobacillus dielmonensis]
MLKSSHIHFTGNIHVQTMERQSGIFIGERNIAIGWSAHGKENRVIGSISGQSNLLFHNISILNDPDIVDTPIDDRDINIAPETTSHANTTNVHLKSLHVNGMQPASSLFVGEGHVTGIDANQKSNATQGNINGNNNLIESNMNKNNDQDVVDAIIDDRDIKIANIKKE